MEHMNQATPNPQDGTKTLAYRGGLEKAMAVVWAEKNKHSVISEAYFALKNVWDELYRESTQNSDDGK
jgi:hypothetical protein